MCFRHVMIQIVPRGKYISAIFAGPGERARKVNVLHMLSQVDPLAPGLAAQDAPVMAAPVRALFNVGVQGSHPI
jgi:hypothetical protein